jgi:hypothetical protein
MTGKRLLINGIKGGKTMKRIIICLIIFIITFSAYSCKRQTHKKDAYVDTPAADGIEVSEKVRALRAAGADMSAVDAVLEKVRTVEITDYKQPWQEIMTEARKALDEAARK